MKVEMKYSNRIKITKNSKGIGYEITVYGNTSKESLKKLQIYSKKVKDFIAKELINSVPRARKVLNKTKEVIL
jgi:hypothetical protein